ncbi:MAG: hypothetical protein C0475_08825 [Planctomyces sp.]|nr:hypothetical protein [Planctomyces sp.]
MRTVIGVVHAAHTAATGVWLAAVVGAGMSAAVIFPEMKSLDARLPDHEEYGGAHWSLAAGRVAARVFAVAESVGLACAAVVMITGVVVWGVLSMRGGAGRWLAMARGLACGAAAGLAGFDATILRPRMDQNAEDYWSAARAGLTDVALGAKRLFDADHPIASGLLMALAASLMANLVLCAWPSPGLIGRPAGRGSL